MTDLPDWHIELWETVVHYDHPTFANWSAPLGDINGDGFDDFAIATATDTTFVFLGGDPFNHEPAFFLYGGGSGIDVGDFNGDGLLDLVTGRACLPPAMPCPENKGQVRIYFRTLSEPYFEARPDLLIEGKPDEYLGLHYSSLYSNVQALDFNGDGYDDLLTHGLDNNDSVDFRALIYFGGPEMDTEYDVEFRVDPVTFNDGYANSMLTGDMNGDGYDDVLIYGYKFGLRYWDLYLGAPQPLQRAVPHRVLASPAAWTPQKDAARIMDINADGYDDIIDAGERSMHRSHGDVLVFLGGPHLPDVILPNDSIPNYDPFTDRFPWMASPVGDMNGDGINDLLIPWAIEFFPGASGYYFYPGGTLYKTPTGYTGTLPEDGISAGAYPAGDVNGDGFDDVLTLGRAASNAVETNRFQIHLGARQLSTYTVPTPVTGTLTLSLSPNPVSSTASNLHIRISGTSAAPTHLTLKNLLGVVIESKVIGSSQSAVSWNVAALPAGVYIVTARQGDIVIHEKLVKI
jgi:hypothetical protein